MGNGRMFLERLAEKSVIASEPVPGKTIVEIAGDRRVLIENHHGVMGYSSERILVKVNYGMVSVRGCALELLRMTGEQLVIQGKINDVSLLRRECR